MVYAQLRGIDLTAMGHGCASMASKDHGPGAYYSLEEWWFGEILSDPSEMLLSSEKVIHQKWTSLQQFSFFIVWKLKLHSKYSVVLESWLENDDYWLFATVFRSWIPVVSSNFLRSLFSFWNKKPGYWLKIGWKSKKNKLFLIQLFHVSIW